MHITCALICGNTGNISVAFEMEADGSCCLGGSHSRSVIEITRYKIKVLKESDGMTDKGVA